jgi:hypothetical protein
MLAVVLSAVLSQEALSPPPIFPAEDFVPPSVTNAPRAATLRAEPSFNKPASPGVVAARSVLSPLIAFGVGVLTVPVAIYGGILLGAMVDPRQGAAFGAGLGALVGGAVGYLFGTAIASTLFDRDPTAFRRALPWAIGATALSTLAFCLVFFLPAVGVAGLPFVIGGSVALAAAVPIFAELSRPSVASGPDPAVALVNF